ncbi:MAG: hypothetical protein JNG86_18280 [Verrucomicrobiaceae bacterium]|nr:hypothetical protein [Verrucomicrobiaceae bacterium]
MKAFIRIFLSAMLMLPACKSTKKEEVKKDNRTGQAQLIGTIEMVNPEQNYVLIHCEERPSLSAGTELIVIDSKGAKSKVVVTPERKGNYLTADIKEGLPTLASLVLLKIRESDVLPVPPPAGAPSAAATVPPPLIPEIENATSSLPPIPPLEFPRSGGASQQPPPLTQEEMLPLPKPIVPQPSAPGGSAPDLSKLPPVVR